MENEKKIQGIFYKIGFGILIIMVGYFCSQYVLKLNEIQKDLYKLQMQMVEMKAQLLTPEQVNTMIDTKIKILEYHYHNKEYSK